MADAITSTCPEATTTPTTGLSTPTGTRAGRQIPPLYTNPSQEPETVFLNTPPLSPALYKRSEDIFPPLPDDDVGKETRRRRFGRMLRQIRDRSEERTTRLKMGDTTGLAPMGRLWDEFVSESEWKSKDLDVYRRLKTAAEVDALIYSRELESGEEGDLIVIDHDWDLIRIPRTELADLCMPTSAVPKDVHCGVRSRGRSGSSPARM